ncbi:MAG: hypothetical protein GXP33_08010 [Spirochaetes bacterium]|nr:hypothetical protein [Spirochaetota bacterium]
MKKSFLYLLFAGIIIFLFAGCPLPLTTNIAADIVITLGRFNPTANNSLYGGVGGTLSVPVTVSDQTGKTLTGDYTIVFTLSADNSLATTGDNTGMGSSSVTAAQEQVADVSIPAAVAAGNYTLFAVISDAADTVKNNNTASISVVVGASNLPNLQIASLAAGSSIASYLPGAAGKVIYKIANAGFAAIASGTTFTVNLTFNLSGTDTSVGSTNITLSAALYPQDFITGTADFTMPSAGTLAADNGEAALTSWSEALTATVDSGGAITETDETDNTNTVTISSGSSKPELSIASVTVADGTDYAKKGNPVEYSVKVENTGLAAAQGYSVVLFVDIDGDGTQNTGDKTLYTWDSPPVVPFDIVNGTNNNVILSVPEGTVYPSDITDGMYYVRAVITGSMEEWDTANNTSTNPNSSQIDFVTTAYDLSIDYMSTSLTGAVNEAAGGSVPVSFRIYNSAGDTVTTDFAVHFYASSDGTLAPAGDTDLGSVTVTDSLSGNSRIIKNTTLTIPGGLGTGYYTIYWIIDDTDAVSELDENNNTPASADECFVFFPVSDGSTGIDARLIVYKPANAPPEQTYIYGSYYPDAWVTYDNKTGYPDQPGEKAFDISCTGGYQLTPGNTVGLHFFGLNYAGYPDGAVPYAFRFVPDYVASVPAAALPSALSSEDTFESNDSQSTAALLSGSNDPLTGFINAFTNYAGYSYNYDYFSFVMP